MEMAIFMMFFLFFMFIVFIVIIGLYLLNSFGLMGILKTNGEKTPALAFVPYYNTYLLGKVGSDNKDSLSKLGIALLVMQIAVSFASSFMGFMISMVENSRYINEEAIILPVLFFMLVTLGYMVLYYVAYSRIFVKYSKNGVLLTVFNILFGGGILGPIFLFAIRNNKLVVTENVDVIQQI